MRRLVALALKNGIYTVGAHCGYRRARATCPYESQHRRNVLKQVLLLILLLSFSTVYAGANEDFQTGVQLYDQGDFAGSADKLQSIIDQGHASAPLYYNAACAYYKAGNIGKAIANFRRAEKMAPDDEDIRTNLAFVKQFSVDKVDASQTDPFLTRVRSVLATLHPNQYFLISFIASALLFVFLSLKRIGAVRRFGNSPILALAAITIISVTAMVWVLRANYLVDEGVIVVEQTEILSGPGSEFELQFEGHEGLTFEVLDQKQDYYLGLFANKLKGWVKVSAVEKI
jgi:tetratricopeptide (TPR) repeat protein